MNLNWQTRLMRRRSQWRVDLTAGSVLLALTIAAYMAVIGPAREARVMAATNAAQLASEQSRIAQLDAVLDTMHAKRESATRLIFGTLPTLTSVNDLNSRISDLADLAASANLQIDALEPDSKPLMAPMFAVIKINIIARGSRGSCRHFAEALHEKMKDMIVTSMELASPTAGDSTTFNLQLLWYASPATAGEKR